MTAGPPPDIRRPWPIPGVSPWWWRTVWLAVIGLLALLIAGDVVAFLSNSTTWYQASLGIALPGGLIVLLTMILTRRGIERLQRTAARVENGIVKILAPIASGTAAMLSELGEVAGRAFAGLFMAAITVLLALLAIGVPLAALYAVVRYVKWAWNN